MKNYMPTHHFKILSQDQRARCGVLYTPHGRINTPVFMPVGTQACVKSLSPDDLYEMQAEIILGNAYHLYLRPGDELIRSLKGLHSFSGWKRPILTDSGGYQVFSLAGLRKLTENGVEFQSHIDGSRHLFTPEKVIQIQNNLGSDIMMPLDECVSYDMERTYTEKSVQLTFNWAQRSLEEHQKGLREQLLFGIVQGGFYKDLRTRSAEQLSSLEFDGLAIGGLSVGEPKKAMLEILNHTAGLLPEEKPRYLMGVGSPMDILRGIKQGIDMFDCVLPTRNARNGTLFSSQGKINIKRQEFKEDPNPVDPYCSCYACRNFSRAYLRHLYISKELLAYRLNSIHNLHFFLELVHQARKAIQKQELDSLIRHYAMFYVD